MGFLDLPEKVKQNVWRICLVVNQCLPQEYFRLEHQNQPSLPFKTSKKRFP